MARNRYQDCARAAGLPARLGVPEPARSESSPIRAKVFSCAAQSGSAALVRGALGDDAGSLDIRVPVRFIVPLEAIATWNNGIDAVEILKEIVARRPELRDRKAIASDWAGAAYAAATVEVARFIVQLHPDVVVVHRGETTLKQKKIKEGQLTLAQHHLFNRRLDIASLFIAAGSTMDSLIDDLPLPHWLWGNDRAALLDDNIQKFLAKHGISINARDSAGNTVLHLAADNDDVALVSALLSAGADPQAVDAEGSLPVHMAAKKNSAAVRQLANKSVIDIADGAGRTALHLAIEERAWDTASVLLDIGASASTRDNKGDTPFSSCFATACALLNRLASVDENAIRIDQRGNSYLHKLAMRTDFDVGSLIDRLVSRGVAPDLPNAENRTALHVAASRGNLAAVRTLLTKNVDPNFRDSQGNTPLHLAASQPVILALLKAGADPDLPNAAGARPVDAETDKGILLFHSRQQVQSAAPSLPKYFSSILVEQSDSNDRWIQLLSPTDGLIGESFSDATEEVRTGTITFSPRDNKVEFRVEVSCEIGVRLQDFEQETSLVIRDLPSVYKWSILSPVKGTNRFEPKVTLRECKIASLLKSEIQIAIKKQVPYAELMWTKILKKCSTFKAAPENPCYATGVPRVRVLVKREQEWQEVGVLRVLEPIFE